jgi:CspA family cold shock protein
MAKGTIRKLVGKYGYGFIRYEGGNDLFFRQSQLQGVDYSSLREGQEVESNIGTDSSGRPQALNVKLPSLVETTVTH